MRPFNPLPARGSIAGRAWCDSQHGMYAKFVLKTNKSLLWGGRCPRKSVNACGRCVRRLTKLIEERGAKVVEKVSLT